MSTSGIPRRPVFEIAREKRWRIWLLFGLLLAIVCAGVWVACLLASLCAQLLFLPVSGAVGWVFTLRGIGLMLAIALPLAASYWLISRIGARERLIKAMHCTPLDPGDHYHTRLANIVEEMKLATGGPRIDCFVVPTLGFNAFSFSDLRGGGVIGVTEGALSRLSRQQLQGIVAHEFGHVLSGSYVTATVSCLLFGIYSGLGDEMEDAVLGSGVAPVGVFAAVVRGWLWVLQAASSVTDAALSRERERLADLAAAGYTRDPLSLAEALRIIGRHPAGAGYIPEGLSPLCIRDSTSRRGLLARWQRTHPTIDERVNALLTLANASAPEFERQVKQADGHLDRREHWLPSPIGGPEPRPVVPAMQVGDTETVCTDSAPVAAAAVADTAHIGACPACGVALRDILYEGAHVSACPSCGGSLIGTGELHRVLARRDVGFTPEQQRLAEQIAASGNQRRRAARLGQDKPGDHLVSCPRCGKTMMHGHYSYEYAIDVDRCTICGVVWFGEDGLEILQVLTERQVE